MTLDTRVPFTRPAALAAGLTDDDLQSCRFRRIYQGVYIRAGIRITVKVRAEAALLVTRPGSYLSHHTAVRLWGGWAPPSADTHVSEPAALRRQRRGICAHRAENHVTPLTRSGLLLAPPDVTFLQLAAHDLSLVDLVSVGDSLVRRGRVTAEQLVDVAATRIGPGARVARRAAAFVRPGVDSVRESRLRMLMVLAGLPEPQVNHVLRGDDGSWSHRIELCYAAIQLAIEYEGRQHATSVQQWNTDIRRRTYLEALGWRFILVTSEGLFDQPTQTLADIKAAMRNRGMAATRRSPGVAWQREFVGEPMAA